MKEDRVGECLEALEEQGRIVTRTSTFLSSVKIVGIANWEVYQDGYVYGKGPADRG